MTREYVCKDCEYIGEVKSGKRGNFLVSTLLWTFVIPGIFYSIWRMTGKNRCKNCDGSHLATLDSEYGKYALEKFYLKNLQSSESNND